MRFLSTASKTNETREKTREREDASDEEVDAGEPYIGAPDIAARAAIEPRGRSRTGPRRIGRGDRDTEGLRFSETGSEKAQSSRESRYFHAL